MSALQRDQASKRTERRVYPVKRSKLMLRNAGIPQNPPTEGLLRRAWRTQLAGKQTRRCVGKDLSGCARDLATSVERVERRKTPENLEADPHPPVERMITRIASGPVGLDRDTRELPLCQPTAPGRGPS
jgi:hypothetical protein